MLPGVTWAIGRLGGQSSIDANGVQENPFSVPEALDECLSQSMGGRFLSTKAEQVELLSLIHI